MNHVTAPLGGPPPIPVIDIGPLRDGSSPQSVAAALHRASREAGFIYVTNHGVDLGFLDEARTRAMEFFHPPAGSKLALGISEKHRGFLKMGAARMQTDALPELKGVNKWFGELHVLRDIDLAQSGMTMICVTHEMGFARKVADTVVFMDQGRIFEKAPPGELFENQRSDRTRLFLSQILSH